ncbi:hypothetical protein [Lacunimicrobium album]
MSSATLISLHMLQSATAFLFNEIPLIPSWVECENLPRGLRLFVGKLKVLTFLIVDPFWPYGS